MDLSESEFNLELARLAAIPAKDRNPWAVACIRDQREKLNIKKRMENTLIVFKATKDLNVEIVFTDEYKGPEIEKEILDMFNTNFQQQ
jgi:hypothetical protein